MARQETTTGAATDAVELLIGDHRAVEQLFRRLDGARGADAREVGERIIHDLSVHAAAEEQVLYPAARDVPGGEALVDESLHGHAELKRVLVDLDGLGPDEAGYAEGFARARQLVDQHVEEEEGELFPTIRQALGRDRLVEMAEALERAKSMAPTRPHPHAPDTPPANIVAGALASVVDTARDALRDANRP